MSEEDKEPFGREAQQKVKAAQDMRQAVLRPPPAVAVPRDSPDEPEDGREVWWQQTKFVAVKTLGEGAYGCVLHVRSSDGLNLAVKLYKPGLNDVQAELDVFKTLLHPNVAVCYGVASTSDSVGLLLELGQGSVAQFLRQNPLSEPAPRQKLFLRWQLSCDWTI